ncbi:DUF2280 domain-containing protein [Dongia sp.]|uniref:DUF2280 domain-containing protein n=1 Tax=Dongia sp. TaxID=1977262 RepID=UPI003751756A
MTSTLTQTAPRQHADEAQFSPDRLKSFIETRLRRREAPERIATAVRGCFGIAFDADQVVPYWRGEITLPTQTEHRPDKESVQIPADEEKEPLFTRMAEAETPDPASAPSPRPSAPATQTGRRRNAQSLQIPADPVDDPKVTREDRDAAIDALGALAKAQLGIAPDPAEAADGATPEEAATQTGRRPNQKPNSELTDEQKAFIVRGLARYETPTRVAASVKLRFGITIDRRQVYAYDPAGSRRPAQRWIDLHAATRAKFLDAASEIGVAQKVVRLRMLDRFANRMEEANYPERAAAFLAQAAKECGGFYERYARTTRAAAPADDNHDRHARPRT